MRCKQMMEWTNEYLDGTMTDEGKQEVEQHLSSCSLCTKYVEEQHKMLGLLSGLEEEELPPGFKQRLLHRLQQSANQDKTKFSGTLWAQQPWLRWGAALAAVFALAFSAYLIQPFKLVQENQTKETPDIQMHSADGNAARYDVAPSEAAPDMDQDDIASLVDEDAELAEDILEDAELPTKIILYVSKDVGTSGEDIQSQILSIAAEFQLDELERQPNKIIFKKNNKVESDILVERLSQLGRIELSGWNTRENTLTIQVIIE